MTKGLIAALVAEIMILAVLLTIAADQIAHSRVEKLGGVNVWGYRGPVLPRKQPTELRIAVTGGDLAFGWGLAASETLAPSVRDLVRHRIDLPGTPERLITGVTIGARGLAPDEYASWIDRYAYLEPDVICVVLDPIGHVLVNPTFLPDRRSVVFATFGYSPILPLVLQEKAALVRSAPLRFIGNTLDIADAALGDRADRKGATVAGGAAHTGSIDAAVRAGLRTSSAGVVVVLAPAHDNGGVTALLASAFSGDRVRLVDLGHDPRMLDAGLRLDGFSFSTAGHAVAAESVAPAVVELLVRAERRTHYERIY
jgi:hypothetical protein